MKKEFIINNKKISLYLKNNDKPLPLVILISFEDSIEDIFNKLNEDIILLNISNIDWDNELSPYKYENYEGKANEFLNQIINEITPFITKGLKIKYSVIAGYSLAGLFSLFAIYNTKAFTRCACISSSFWYPNFTNYIKENNFSGVEKIYFSLGDKESKTKNQVMAKVEENTKEIYDYLKDKTICTFEMNEGNHFKNINDRIVKGIKWVIKD